MTTLRTQLAEPFEPKHITWKPGATTKDGAKCMAMAYADLRAYMERLDDICDMDWKVEYEPWGANRIIARLTINGVTRCSTGEMEAQDEKNGMGGTVAEAQAFKRACAMFGMGRYLYDLPSVWIEFDSAKKRISDAGQKELDTRYSQWYARHLAQRPQATQTGTVARPTANGTTTTANAATSSQGAPVQASNPFDDSTPYYVADWNKLTGKEYDLVKWVRDLHKASDGPCTAKQYQYLSGVIDAITDNNHSYVLTLLCQTEISKANMPGAKVATKLLELLVRETKGENDAPVNSPTYRQDIADMIASMVKQLAPAAI